MNMDCSRWVVCDVRSKGVLGTAKCRTSGPLPPLTPRTRDDPSASGSRLAEVIVSYSELYDGSVLLKRVTADALAVRRWSIEDGGYGGEAPCLHGIHPSPPRLMHQDVRC
ncbi:hypothetical protein PLESTM_000878700 [Pleodorina starrii]|nr:hypothetical protein PLESTM_000878700 [Pleodorina starrii]